MKHFLASFLAQLINPSLFLPHNTIRLETVLEEEITHLQITSDSRTSPALFLVHLLLTAIGTAVIWGLVRAGDLPSDIVPSQASMYVWPVLVSLHAYILICRAYLRKLAEKSASSYSYAYAELHQHQAQWSIVLTIALIILYFFPPVAAFSAITSYLGVGIIGHLIRVVKPIFKSYSTL